MPMDSAVAAKEAERLKIANDIERFLKAKGQVEVLGNTPFRKIDMLDVRQAAAASASRHFAQKDKR